MVPAITHWRQAQARLVPLHDPCQAFQRGDQPEKVEHLTLEALIELYDQAKAILDFCDAVARHGRHQWDWRMLETYRYARQYAVTLARVLISPTNVRPSPELKEQLESWINEETRRLPAPVRIPADFVS